jgi:hypothetical protein
VTIEGATVIRTGFNRGSGYDKIFLRTVDGRVVVLQVETTTDDDMCIGIEDLLDRLQRKIKICKEDIKDYEKQIEEMKKWEYVSV